MRKLLLIAVVAIGLTSCTPGEAIYVAFHPIGGNDLVAQANRVAECESRHNPGAVSPGGGNHGLFQINGVHAPRFPHRWWRRYESLHNATMAAEIYKEQGWRPWSCRP